jgi:hypothetical protein
MTVDGVPALKPNAAQSAKAYPDPIGIQEQRPEKAALCVG